jgi:hypothetical protein
MTCGLALYGVTARIRVALLVALVVFLGCSRTHEASLRALATDVCDGVRPLVISIGRDDQYALNAIRMDSATLLRALENVLPPTPARDRLVMVSLSPSRASELNWIVRAVRQHGGEAYAFDSACTTPRLGNVAPLFERYGAVTTTPNKQP